MNRAWRFQLLQASQYPCGERRHLSTKLVAGVFLAVALYLVLVDFLKVRIFAYSNLH